MKIVKLIKDFPTCNFAVGDRFKLTESGVYQKVGGVAGYFLTHTVEKFPEFFEPVEMSPKAEFLQFIHDRMIFHHKENENFDYMIKLREIIQEMILEK